MPMITEDAVTAFAHCTDPYCEGMEQQEVVGVRTKRDNYYTDFGGDIPGIESSHVYLRFAHEDDLACPHCGTSREISEQKRPVYKNSSGQDPLALLKRAGEAERKISGLQLEQAQRDREMDDLKRKIEDLTAQLAGKANKPGPKPKAEDG